MPRESPRSSATASGKPATGARRSRPAPTFPAAAEALFRRGGKPPYLPFATTGETANSPDSGDYYQLFASLIAGPRSSAIGAARAN